MRAVSRTAQGSTSKRALADHLVEQLREVLDDDVRAVLAQRLGLPDAVDADDDAEVAGAAGLDPGERVLEHGRRGRLDAERRGRREERVGRRLALQVARASATWPSTISSNRSMIPADSSTARQLVLDETTARRSPASRDRMDVAHRALVGLDPLLVDQPQDERVLAVAEPGDRLGVGRVVGRALGQLDPARLRGRSARRPPRGLPSTYRS